MEAEKGEGRQKGLMDQQLTRQRMRSAVTLHLLAFSFVRDFTMPDNTDITGLHYKWGPKIGKVIMVRGYSREGLFFLSNSTHFYQHLLISLLPSIPND